jgi:regulatory protein
MKRNLLEVTATEALEKMRNWCAYQERSQQDARMKLRSFKLNAEQIENVIAHLISENYLNEERFAMAFTGGKFRIKHWGRIKIKMELKKHGVSEKCIKTAINSIDPEAYLRAMKGHLNKKIALTKGNDRRKKFYSALKFAVSKGFESDLLIEELNVILGEQE